MPTKNFEKYLYDLSKPYYKKILQSDFIQGIISGNLAKEKFCFYLSQDSLYLSKEVDFFSSLSQKANSQEEKHFFEKLAQDCIAIEQEMQKVFFKEFLVNPSSKLWGTFASYSAFLEEQTLENYAQAIFAFLPCYLLYDLLGKEIIFRHKTPNTYLSYINTYAGEPYQEFVKTYLHIAKFYYLKSDLFTRKNMEKIFLEACAWEVAIFEFVGR